MYITMYTYVYNHVIFIVMIDTWKTTIDTWEKWLRLCKRKSQV